MESAHRLLALFVLIGLVLGVNFLYVTMDFRSYPSAEEIMTDPGMVDGQDVFIFEEVESVTSDQQRVTILLEDKYFAGLDLGGDMLDTRDEHEITVLVADATVVGSIQAGSYIQIHGRLTHEFTRIDAHTIVVEYQHTGDWLYTYGMSLFGGLIACIFFFRHWRITPTGFAPRRDP